MKKHLSSPETQVKLDKVFMDFTSLEGRRFYLLSTTKLSEELFNCEPKGLCKFLNKLKDKTRIYGWNDEGIGITFVSQDIDKVYENLIDVITNHGRIRLEQIKNHVETYIDTESRTKQDADMLYMCLMNFLLAEGKQKVLIWQIQFSIRNLPSDVSLLKINIGESHLNSYSTGMAIRRHLRNLFSYMRQISSDVVKFNSYVKL